MEFITPSLQKYIDDHTPEASELLEELSRETHLKVLQPRMISGRYQGRFLSLISKLVAPRTILEIGTYTGYSAICLAEGLAADGVLHTIDINEELSAMQQRYFARSPQGEKIISHIGDALEIIPAMDMVFDLVFIDAEKSSYPDYLDVVLEKTRSGSLILSDNVLWSGKVAEKLDPNDKATAALLQFNDRLHRDEALETVILPVRDGLSLCRVR